MVRKPAKIKIRKTWAINPLTRIKENKKIYSRRKLKQEVKKAISNVQSAS